VALVTSFGIEELEYLKSLPEFDGYPTKYVWQGWARGPRDKWHSGADTCAARGCDAWQHVHEGWVYLRHGEMLAKLPEGTSENFSELLTSLHAHEAAVR
jgi:hypothetical protein